MINEPIYFLKMRKMSASIQSSTRKAYSAKKLLALSIHINAFDMSSKNIEYTSCSINYFRRTQ